MLKEFWAFTANALLSACIGLFIGLLLITLPVDWAENSSRLLLITTGIGFIVDVASRLSSCLVYQYGLKNPFWGYGLTFLITLSGCTLPVRFIGSSGSQQLLSIIVAEPLALTAAYLNLRYAAHLNNSLKRKQTKLKQPPI